MKKSKTRINLANTHRSLVLGLASAISALGTASSIHAQSTWSGATSNDWNDATNWSAGVPSAVNAIINTSTGNYPILTTNPSATPVDVIIANGTTTTGRLDQTAGTLSTGNGNYLYAGNGGSSVGTYNLADTATTGGTYTGFGLGSGSVTVGGGTNNGRLVLGNGGTSIGTLNINTSGTVNANLAGLGLLVGTNGGDGFVNLDNGTLNTTSAWFGDNNAGSSGQLQMSGGTFTATEDLIFGRTRGTGTGIITGGTVNARDLQVAYSTSTASATVGTVTISNATLNATGFITLNSSNYGIVLARSNTASIATQGTLNVNSGGIVNSVNDVLIAFAGNSSTVGALNINSGGTVNVGTAAEKWLVVNRWDSAQGRLTVDGGTLNLQNNTDIRFSIGNGVGTSFVTVKNGGAIVGGATSVVDLMNAAVVGNNTFNLDGGTLTISQVMTNNNTGTAVFNFNGGTLKAAAASTTFVDLGGASQSAVVKSGGAIIDSNGFNVTIPQALVDGTGGGGLTKSGLGTLTLSGVNTYTGSTTVGAGTLALGSAGTLASTGYTIANGAEFDVSAKASYALSGVTTTVGLDASTGGLFDAGTIALDFTGGTVSLSFSTASLIDGHTYNLFDFGSQTGDLGGVSLAGSFSGSLALTGQIWSGTSGGYGFSFNEADGILTVSAIPEPAGVAALFGVVALGATAVRRRRRG